MGTDVVAVGILIHSLGNVYLYMNPHLLRNFSFFLPLSSFFSFLHLPTQNILIVYNFIIRFVSEAALCSTSPLLLNPLSTLLCLLVWKPLYIRLIVVQFSEECLLAVVLAMFVLLVRLGICLREFSQYH